MILGVCGVVALVAVARRQRFDRAGSVRVVAEQAGRQMQDVAAVLVGELGQLHGCRVQYSGYGEQVVPVGVRQSGVAALCDAVAEHLRGAQTAVAVCVQFAGAALGGGLVRHERSLDMRKRPGPHVWEPGHSQL